MTGSQKGTAGTSRVVEAIVFAGILLAAFALRWGFRDVPLIRDEAELVHQGQRILHGDVPYLDLYNQKTPFAFYLMAAVQGAVGEHLAAIRVATTLWGLVAVGLVYVFTRRLFGPVAGGFAALALGLLSFHQNGAVHQATGESLAGVWGVAALTLWYWSGAPRRSSLVALSGVAAGLAYQTKQSALVVLVFLVVDSFWSTLRSADIRRSWRRAVAEAGLVAVGFAAVVLGTLAFFAAQGALGAYLECTWTNNFEYVGERPGGWHYHLSHLRWALRWFAAGDVWLWLLGAFGLLSLELRRHPRRGHGLWILLLGCVAMALAGGKPFRQYWEPLALPVAVGVGVASSVLWSTFADRGRASWLRLMAFVLAVAIWTGPATRTADTLALRTDLEGPSFWTAAARMGREIRANSQPDDALLVVGSEPEIFFHAGLSTVSRMVITYPMLGPYSYAERLREEFLNDVRRNPPRYVVRVESAGSLSEGGADVPGFLAALADALGPAYAPIASREVEPPTWRAGKGQAKLTLYRRHAPAPKSPPVGSPSSL